MEIGVSNRMAVVKVNPMENVISNRVANRMGIGMAWIAMAIAAGIAMAMAEETHGRASVLIPIPIPNHSSIGIDR
jgi:hypothetical protein